jgi:hypothetical protein
MFSVFELFLLCNFHPDTDRRARGVETSCSANYNQSALFSLSETAAAAAAVVPEREHECSLVSQSPSALSKTTFENMIPLVGVVRLLLCLSILKERRDGYVCDGGQGEPPKCVCWEDAADLGPTCLDKRKDRLCDRTIELAEVCVLVLF